MNQFQLGCLSTPDLVLLRDSASAEIKLRMSTTPVARRERFIKSLSPVHEKPPEGIIGANSGLLALPNHHVRKYASNVKYLPLLIEQDWSHIYFGGDDRPLYYVYAHVDPSKQVFSAQAECGGNYGGQPFYIGKGIGSRAYDLRRNQGHGKYIKNVIQAGYGPEHIVKIAFDGLTEAKAFEIEAKLVYFFGSIYSKSVKKKGALVNLDIPKIPQFSGVMVEEAGRRR